jgi:Arc/MetJ family transcription regulator
VRTNIEIADELMAQALKLTGLPTKRAVVEEGLRLMVRLRKQARALKSLKGLGGKATLMRCGGTARRARRDLGRQLGLDRAPSRVSDAGDRET